MRRRKAVEAAKIKAIQDTHCWQSGPHSWKSLWQRRYLNMKIGCPAVNSMIDDHVHDCNQRQRLVIVLLHASSRNSASEVSKDKLVEIKKTPNSFKEINSTILVATMSTDLSLLPKRDDNSRSNISGRSFHAPLLSQNNFPMQHLLSKN